MKVVIQRVSSASVVIDNKEISHINKGLLIFVGFKKTDNIDIINKVVKKIINLRIFESNDKMDLNINDINGSILSVSQFTLYASTKKGARPSFTDAMEYDKASVLYDKFNEMLCNNTNNVETGIFGADMKVSIINDGPVTIIIEEE